MKKTLIIVFLLNLLNTIFAEPIQLAIKPLGSDYIKIPVGEKGAIPIIAGENYMLKLSGTSLNKIMSLFPYTEKEKIITPTNVYFVAIKVPKDAKRGNTYCITACAEVGNPKTFCFEVVTKGKIEEIRYVANELPKHLGGVDRLNPNKTYSLVFSGKEMENAKFNVNRFPNLVSGTFISLFSQQSNYESKGLMLQFRVQKGEKELTTSLLYHLNNIGIIDANADMDMPWIRYTIGTGDVFNPQLPVDASAHLSDLNRVQLN